MSKKIVIVGAGQAGVATAFKLRSHGHDGPITLLGEEPHLPYHRPPLSKKFVTDRLDVERLHIRQADLYEKEGISLVSDSHVEAIDRVQRRVRTSNGQAFDYDALVLATGSQARLLPFDEGGRPGNVLTLRTLGDAVSMRERFVPDNRLLVIGGGYIGLESAAVARSLGMTVTLVERDTRILNRVASPETAAYFRDLHRKHGVTIYEGAGIAQFDRSGDCVTAVTLTDGTRIAVDVVVVGIGVMPRTDLAARVGLAVENGIVVEQSCRTSDPLIYSLGDCASFPYRDRSIRLESVQNAVDMADVVARSIMGEQAQYDALPWFWSDQYSTKLQIAGLNAGANRVAVRQNTDDSLSVWYFDGDQLVAVDAINDSRAFMTAKRWLGMGHAPSWEDVQDISIALGDLPVSVRRH